MTDDEKENKSFDGLVEHYELTNLIRGDGEPWLMAAFRAHGAVRIEEAKNGNTDHLKSKMLPQIH